MVAVLVHSSSSMVNCMDSLSELRCLRKACSSLSPCVQVSSTYLIQSVGLCVAVSMAISSKNSIYRLTKTGENGDPIAAPSVCS